MILRRILSFLGAFGLAGATTLLAAETSDPVGAFRIRLRGNSDTIVSLPLQRPALVEAAIVSRTNNVLTLEADLPALSPEGAFALVMTGALEGAVLPIASVSARTVTLDPTTFDLAILKTTAAHTASLADLVAIVPYWTLDTLFPSGQAVHVSASPATRATEILFFDATRTGTNHAPSTTFFYFAGNASKSAGWYKVGDTAAPLGSQRIAPHTYFVVRHNLSTDTVLLVAGGVQMAGFRLPIGTRTANQPQDNLLALPIATPITLGASGLGSSGAFAASSGPATRADELLVFDNSTVGQNKAPVVTFFYFAGNASKPAGWYKVGDTAQTSDQFLLRPGEGYIVRKQSAATAQTQQWHAIPTYLQ